MNGPSVSMRATGSSELLSELFSESLEIGGDASEIPGTRKFLGTHVEKLPGTHFESIVQRNQDCEAEYDVAPLRRGGLEDGW